MALPLAVTLVPQGLDWLYFVLMELSALTVSVLASAFTSYGHLFRCRDNQQLLALPIPFTNYVFGFLLLLFAFALLERDGALLLVAWIAGSIAVVVFGFLSGNLVEATTALLARWF